jgi:hypothetical protein
MVKTSVFLEDMALLDSIDVEEEIIDNAIYLKLSIGKIWSFFYFCWI